MYVEVSFLMVLYVLYVCMNEWFTSSACMYVQYVVYVRTAWYNIN